MTFSFTLAFAVGFFAQATIAWQLIAQLNRAVKRNRDRFPGDFMFQLTAEEVDNLRYQDGTSSWGGRRYSSYAFTEQGVATFSSMRRSKRAIMVSIEIMRAFVRLRQILGAHADLARKLAAPNKPGRCNFSINSFDEEFMQSCTDRDGANYRRYGNRRAWVRSSVDTSLSIGDTGLLMGDPVFFNLVTAIKAC